MPKVTAPISPLAEKLMRNTPERSRTAYASPLEADITQRELGELRVSKIGRRAGDAVPASNAIHFVVEVACTLVGDISAYTARQGAYCYEK